MMMNSADNQIELLIEKVLRKWDVDLATQVTTKVEEMVRSGAALPPRTQRLVKKLRSKMSEV